MFELCIQMTKSIFDILHGLLRIRNDTGHTRSYRIISEQTAFNNISSAKSTK